MALPSKKIKLPVPTEHQEQTAFVRWFAWQFPGVLIFAIPNGAMLAGDHVARAKQAARLKAEGMVPGVPDLFVPAWDLFIEFKRSKGGYLSKEQKAIHERLRAAGKEVIVVRGLSDAMKMVRVASIAPVTPL